jgi:hypothetical protein
MIRWSESSAALAGPTTAKTAAACHHRNIAPSLPEPRDFDSRCGDFTVEPRLGGLAEPIAEPTTPPAPLPHTPSPSWRDRQGGVLKGQRAYFHNPDGTVGFIDMRSYTSNRL